MAFPTRRVIAFTVAMDLGPIENGLDATAHAPRCRPLADAGATLLDGWMLRWRLGTPPTRRARQRQSESEQSRSGPVPSSFAREPGSRRRPAGRWRPGHPLIGCWGRADRDARIGAG